MGAFPCCKKIEPENEINTNDTGKKIDKIIKNITHSNNLIIPSHDSSTNIRKETEASNKHSIIIPNEPNTSPLQFIQQEGIKLTINEAASQQLNDYPSSPALSLLIIRGFGDGSKITIPPFGLSMRKDGCSNFGKEQSDYNLNADFSDDKQFSIKFSNGKYYIKDLESPTATYVKATSPIAITNGSIVSFGDSHMMLFIAKNIKIKFLEGPMKCKEFSFEFNDLPIRVGCDPKSNIVLENGTCKEQCRIFGYDDLYYIVDGNGTSGSTMGTWIYAHQFLEVSENTIIKAGSLLFQASIEYN